MLFGLHSEGCDAGIPVVLHRVFIVEGRCALVGRRPHRLHTLDHAGWAVEEAVAGVGGLQRLRGAHEPRNGVHGCGTGNR